MNERQRSSLGVDVSRVAIWLLTVRQELAKGVASDHERAGNATEETTLQSERSWQGGRQPIKIFHPRLASVALSQPERYRLAGAEQFAGAFPRMVRIVIVGPVRLYREALASLLEACEGIAIVGLAGSGADGLAQVYEHQPDVVLLDPTLPQALWFARHLRSLPFSPHILALATDGETQILDGLEQGIAGFVPSASSIGDLLQAVDSVQRDELFYPPRLGGLLARRMAALGARHSPEVVHGLTEREREILALIKLGCSNKEAARHLGIEVATVKTHVHNLLAKLGVHRRAQAAAGAI